LPIRDVAAEFKDQRDNETAAEEVRAAESKGRYLPQEAHEAIAGCLRETYK
jgi:hypothetical protein